MVKHQEVTLEEFNRIKATKDVRRIDDFGLMNSKPGYRKITILYVSNKKTCFLYLHVEDDGSEAVEKEIFNGYQNARAKHSYYKFAREAVNENDYYERFQTRVKR